MARARWIVPWAELETKPAVYHCVARVVDKRFAFGPDDKEQFRICMRMMQNFSGCRSSEDAWEGGRGVGVVVELARPALGG